MTPERKLYLMTGPRNEAGVGSVESVPGSLDQLREEYRELEKEGLVEVIGPEDALSEHWSDVHTVTVTPKGRAFLAEHSSNREQT